MYETQVKAAADALDAQDNRFFAHTVDRAKLKAAAGAALATLDDDIARIKKDAGVLFPPSLSAANSEAEGKKLAALFDSWRANPPSTTALLCVAAEHFGISEDSKNFQAALMASFAANVMHDNAYHSTSHFREVTAAIARLVGANNDLAASGAAGAEFIDAENAAKCLLAAASHDLLHDGKGNAPAGPQSWQQYRLEDWAVAAALPFMQLAGMAEKDQDDVRVMIRVTDISAKINGLSPHKYLRRIYAETFETAPALSEADRALEIPAGLEALKTDRTLLVMAALLSDADLTPSAAADYAFGRKMTTLFSEEMPATIKDNDRTLVGFIKFVTEQKFTSAAGNAAGGGALSALYGEAEIRAKKEKELEDSNSPPASPRGPRSGAPK